MLLILSINDVRNETKVIVSLPYSSEPLAIARSFNDLILASFYNLHNLAAWLLILLINAVQNKIFNELFPKYAYLDHFVSLSYSLLLATYRKLSIGCCCRLCYVCEQSRIYEEREQEAIHILSTLTASTQKSDCS